MKKPLGIVLAGVLGLVAATAGAQNAAPQAQDLKDAKEVASLLIVKSIAGCVSKFDVVGVDTIKQTELVKGEKFKYELSGTIVWGDIARGRSTMTIMQEKKQGSWQPYWSYSCEVKEDIVNPGPSGK